MKQGIVQGYFQAWETEVKLDLHLATTNADGGACTASVANALLYDTLCEYAEGTREIQGDLEVVTGRGRGSGSDGPVLTTSTRAFLTTIMDPPLEIQDHPTNAGSFTVPAASLLKWASANGSSKGAVSRTSRDWGIDWGAAA